MEELNSISDDEKYLEIDKMLDAEYAKLDDSESEETPVEEETSEYEEETTETESDSEQEQSNDKAEPEESVETPEVKPVEQKPTKDEQQSYSFKALREERDNYRKQSEQYESDSTFLKELAVYYGYTDSDSFKKALRDAQLEKEATSKGIDPTMYRQLNEQNERIKQLEKEKETEILNHKAEKFNREIDEIVSELNLGEKGAEIVFQKLAENGFTEIDQVLNLPNVKPLLRGLLSDYVKSNAEQKQIKAIEKAKSVSDNPANDTATDNSISLDAIIAKEMKRYKEDNFL